jgi:integrase
VVKFGVKPILRELGLPTKGVGLHAFRHGIATELARIISLVDVQKDMRHADIKSTLKYIHTDKAVQRKALETLQSVQFGD